MKEVAEDATLRAQAGAVGREAVDRHASRLELLHDLLDLVKMMIDLDLLRLVVQAHHAAIDRRLQIDADARRIAHDLRHLLVQRQEQLRSPRRAPSAM